MSDEIDALLSDLECLSEAQTGPATIKFAPHPPPRSNENQISNPKLKYIRPELSCVSNGGVDAVLQYGQSPDFGSKLSNIVTSDDEEDDKLLSSFSPTSLNMILQTQSPKNNGSPIKNIYVRSNNENDNITNSCDSNSFDQLLEQLKSPTIASNSAVTPHTTAHDFDNDDDAYDSATKVSATFINHLSSTDNNDSKLKTVRCIRVIIGGSNIPRGLKSSSFSKVVCNNLRCIQCNFKVLAFADKVWSHRVDYMFFRNNFPTKKLGLELVDSQNHDVAYCCQCSWITISDEKEITSNNNNETIKWICSGH